MLRERKRKDHSASLQTIAVNTKEETRFLDLTLGLPLLLSC